MRLVMVAPFGMRPKGTLSQRALPLAQALARRGVHVRIVAPAYLNPQDAGRIEVIDGVEVVHAGLPRLGGPLAYLETAMALVRSAHAWHPDVVHVFKPKGYSGLAAALLRRIAPRMPIVQDTDDWEGWGGWNDLLPYPTPMKHFFAWQERTLLQEANAVTVASHTLQTQSWGFGVPPARVTYLPNGVGPVPLLPSRAAARSALGLGEEPVMLLYTRFWEYPLSVVLELLVGLRTQQPATRLLVLGEGERNESQTLVQWATRVGVAQQLDLRGWVALPTIQLAMAAADVAVVPFADTLMNRAKCSVKLLELLNVGLPVVASAVGQANEYIKAGESGLLVTPGDGGALAYGVLQLLADDEQRLRMGKQGQAFVQAHYGWEQIAERLYEVISKEVVNRKS